MATSNAQAIATLNELIQTCKDGEYGYRTAAHGLKIPEVKKLFLSYADQRALFATELQNEVQRLGGEPAESGSVTATLHRGWINIKAIVAGSDPGAIIGECERGEEAARKVYADALQAELPEESRAIVARQFEQIKEAYTRVDALEEVCARS